MKKYILYIGCLIFILALGNELNAQGKTHEQDIRTVFAKLVLSSQAKNYDEATGLISIDTGKEVSDNQHKQKVRRICNQVYALLQLSDYSIADYNATFDDGITHYNLVVKFVSGEQEIEKRFQFIESNDKYLLDKID